MSLWQTKSWGEFLVASDQAEAIFSLSSGIQVEQRRVALGEYGLFVLGVHPNDVSEEVCRQLQQLCQQHNCLFTQIETLDYDGLPIPDTSWKSGYYKKFITHDTAVIDLTQSLEEIRSAMKPKGRYNIGLAQKKGVEVRCVDTNEQYLQAFYTLMQETTQRDGFAGNTLEYYRQFLQSQAGARLLLAYYEGVVIAAAICVFGDEVSLYYYGASSSDKQYRNLMAPYLLQWEAICQARERGSRYYDFLGVAPEGKPDHPLSGVTNFKMKLSGDRRRVSESILFVSKKWKFCCISLLRRIKK